MRLMPHPVTTKWSPVLLINLRSSALYVAQPYQRNSLIFLIHLTDKAASKHYQMLLIYSIMKDYRKTNHVCELTVNQPSVHIALAVSGYLGLN